VTAPSFVNSTAQVTTSTTPTITKPTSTADGDLIILFAAMANGGVAGNGAALTPPDSSWVRLRYRWDGSFHDNAGYPDIEVWGKISASDGASWSWTASTSGQTAYICYAIRPSTGAWATARDAVLCVANGIGSSTTTPSIPDLTGYLPVATDWMQICLSSVLRGDTTFTAPTGFTKSGDVKGTGDLNTRISAACAYKAQTAATPSTGTWTQTNVRAEALFSIGIVDPSVAAPFRLKEIVGARASGPGNAWGTTSSPTIKRGSGAIGDLEVLACTYKNTNGYMSTPSGYTLWAQGVGSGSSANMAASMFYRELDGTEGDTLALTMAGTGVDGAAYVFTIPGKAYPLSAVTNTDNTSADPIVDVSPSVPATNSPGAFWAAGAIMHRNDGTGMTSASTGYTTGGNVRATGIGSSNTRSCSEWKFDTAANAGTTAINITPNSYFAEAWAFAVGTSPVIQNLMSVVLVG
jgi:hypothetical protein